MTDARRMNGAVAVGAILVIGGASVGGIGDAGPPDATSATRLECGTRSPWEWAAAFRDAVDRGEIPAPAARRLPPPARPARLVIPTGSAGCLTGEHIFAFEDSKDVLMTNFTDVELFLVLIDAINSVLATHGDEYDFVGFWLNFQPHHTIGTAFYGGISNNVSGIGLPGFDNHDAFGIIGERLQGLVMMWNVNSSFWRPGDGSDAGFTRLVLGQEFEHRFAMFLPELLDGRVLQGNDANCGRSAHWNWQVDGQGSSMEISEWVGSDPAIRNGSSITFNTDIGGVFSYTDLYLMGYVSPADMDAGNSELRFMEESNCASPYFGPISDFTSADIIASAGARVPDSTDAQKHFKTAWVMIHRPGAPPTGGQLLKATGILEQHMTDWSFSTLALGTMDNQLFPDCNCNGVPDSDDIAGGTSDDDNGNGIPDECECTADVDGNGEVDFADVLAILAAWGNEGGPEDVDDSGVVDFGDILLVLAAWGPCVLPIPADDCTSAPVAGDGSFQFSTLSATTDGPTLPKECDDGNGVRCRKDVWIRYVASCTGTATAGVCNSDFDTRIVVYEDGDCPGPFLACNDDACGEGGTRSEVSFPVQSGGTYLIRIGSPRFETGGGTLVIDCAE